PRGSGALRDALTATITAVTIPLTTASTTATTGALVVAGGVGIDGDINSSGAISAVNYHVSGAITGGASGLALNAGGSNQSITLTPTGTGIVQTSAAQLKLDSGSASTANFVARTLGGAGSSVHYTLEGLSSNDEQSILWRRGQA